MFFSACVIIWVPFIDNLGVWVSSVGGGTPRELANAHTMFNVVNALLFLPFIRQFAALVTWVTPDRPQVGVIEPKYIDLGLLRTPGIALAKARMEMLRMSYRVRSMLEGDRDALADVRERDDEVDALHGLILEYLGQISQMQLSEEASAP